ncbi:MAG TPA: hypothetical protein VK446_16830 [Methylocystis sp.]|nr:hypothetical protein [Methylocystis sp.]
MRRWRARSEQYRFVVLATAAACVLSLLLVSLSASAPGTGVLHGWSCAQAQTADAASPSQGRPASPDHHREGFCCALLHGGVVDVTFPSLSSLIFTPPEGGFPFAPFLSVDALPKASELSSSAPRGPPISIV